MPKINSISAIDAEINRLQARAKELENQLDESLDYLQDNYSSMIMNSVLSRAAGGFKGGVTGTILSIILSSEKLVGAVSKIASDLVDRAANGIDRLAEKMSKKKAAADGEEVAD